ncbi:enoyl-CoA hydratase/isomerase family protein [Actinomadura luteofluorescens]
MSARVEVAEGVATITIGDPHGRNALDLESVRALAAAVAAAAGSPANVILLRAEGTAFCVGGSIDFFADCGDALHDRLLEFFEVLNPAVRLLHETPKITIAAAHGAVAGGGVGLMAAADVVLMARSSVVTLAYEQLGASPDAGVSWFLARDIGYRRALALYLSSERIDAQQALELGLVTSVVEDDELERHCREFALRAAAGSPVAHTAAKRLLRQASVSGLDRQLEDESRAFADNARRPEFARGVAAFLGRRAGGRHAGA